MSMREVEPGVNLVMEDDRSTRDPSLACSNGDHRAMEESP